VAELAQRVDGGLAPQAGVDLFERLRKATGASPVQLALDVVEGRALLARGQLPHCQAVLKRAMAGVQTAKEQALPVLGLAYDVALAYRKAGNVKSGNEALAEAEAMAQELPPSAEVTALRCAGLVSAGRPDFAVEIAWNAAMSGKQPAQRQQMLLLYVPAAVAAGREAEILSRLESMKAPAGIFTAAAGALAQAGKAETAMAMLDAVSAKAAVADPQVAGGVTAVVQHIHQQHQQAAARQAARCRAIAAEYAVAAKTAEAAKDAPKAAEHARQAVAFLALAAQLQK